MLFVKLVCCLQRMLKSVFIIHTSSHPIKEVTCPVPKKIKVEFLLVFKHFQADILLLEKCNVLCEISLNPYCIMHFLGRGLSMFILFHWPPFLRIMERLSVSRKPTWFGIAPGRKMCFFSCVSVQRVTNRQAVSLYEGQNELSSL